MMVEARHCYLERASVDDDDSPGVEAAAYHEVGNSRFDAVGLDGDGEFVVALEAERSNHDTREAVPAD